MKSRRNGDMVLRAHSDVLLLVHVVFATRNRVRSIPRSADDGLHEQFRTLAARKQAEVLAVGNADDHVHLVLSLPPAAALADLVCHLKSTTSRAWGVDGAQKRMRWQVGYWARSVEVDSAGRLLDYVHNQRERHRRGTTIGSFEQTAATKSILE